LGGPIFNPQDWKKKNEEKKKKMKKKQKQEKGRGKRRMCILKLLDKISYSCLLNPFDL
jgi:hypothetical protein